MPAIYIFLLYYLAPAEPRDADDGSVLRELELEVVARGVVLDGAHVDPRLRRQHDVRQHLRLLHLVSGGGKQREEVHGQATDEVQAFSSNCSLGFVTRYATRCATLWM